MEPHDHDPVFKVLRAEMDCIVAMSACPQDILPINGKACKPTEVHYQVISNQ